MVKPTSTVLCRPQFGRMGRNPAAYRQKVKHWRRSSVENAAQAARWSRPPRPRPRSPGWCPSRAPRTRGAAPSPPRSRSRQLAQAREVRPRLLGLARRSGGIVMRPREHAPLGAARALEEARRRSPSGTPYLRLLAGDVDLQQHPRAARSAWRSIWSRTDSLSTEWISRTRGSTCLVLRLWRWPMKSNVKRVAPALLLCDQRLGGVLAHELRCRPRASAPICSSGTYLVAASSSTSAGSRPARAQAAAIRSRTAARCARTRAGSSALYGAEPREAGLAAGDAAVAAVGEEQLRVAARADARRARSSGRTPSALELAPHRERQVEPPAVRSRRRGRCARTPSLTSVADLVAARPDRRARSRRATSPPSAEPRATASTARVDDPRRHAAPAAVDHRRRRPARRARAERSRRPARAASRPRMSVDLRVRLAQVVAGASARGVGGGCVVTCTSAPCTWRPIATPAGSRPSADASRPRLRRDRAGSSSVRMPRLSDSYGALADAAEPGAEGGAARRAGGLDPRPRSPLVRQSNGARHGGAARVT